MTEQQRKDLAASLSELQSEAAQASESTEFIKPICVLFSLSSGTTYGSRNVIDMRSKKTRLNASDRIASAAFS